MVLVTRYNYEKTVNPNPNPTPGLCSRAINEVDWSSFTERKKTITAIFGSDKLLITLNINFLLPKVIDSALPTSA